MFAALAALTVAALAGVLACDADGFAILARAAHAGRVRFVLVCGCGLLPAVGSLTTPGHRPSTEVLARQRTAQPGAGPRRVGAGL